ncbi:MAG: DUF4118 domain-containing protein [Candidatus Aminicenantes bacterium]|nr:DUF4118 domain-containing protein [Candidatus Aminicenantes bacterium]
MPKLIVSKYRSYLISLGLVAFMSLIGEFVQRYFDLTNLVMLYLLAVIISANRYGRGPSIVTAVISVIAFDFLFVPPRFTLTVADTQYLLTFAGLLIVGIVISELASKMRARAIEARNREIQTVALYDLSRDLSGTLSLEKAIQVILFHIKKILAFDLTIYLQEGESVKFWNSGPPRPENEQKKIVAKQILSGERASGNLAGQFSELNVRYVPMRASGKTIGVLSFDLEENQELSPEKVRMLEAISNQAALAIERLRLLEENRQIELLHEKERLQSAVLSSISHDLKTPLVSITGSLGTLLQKNRKLSSSARQELIETAYEESVRMARFVDHLLDMARLEAGALKVNYQSCDLQEVIGVALEELKEKLIGRQVRVNLPKDMDEVSVDFFLLTKVMVNLIDNAAKYSLSNTPIEITARAETGHLQIRVTDHGYGIPARDLERVFDKFYRVAKTQNIHGTGLGLTICRGIVELHGGRMWVESQENMGTTVIIDIPIKAN